MELQKLTLTNVRGFTQAEFDFQPGMNLLVGINGAGKSTVLDVLRIALAQNLPKFTRAKKQGVNFAEEQISMGKPFLTVNSTLKINNQSFDYLFHLPREDFVVNKSGGGSVRDQTIGQSKQEQFSPSYKNLSQNKNSPTQPLALFFSAHRSVISTKRSTATGQAGAFADALIPDRGLKVREYAEWWLVQSALLNEANIQQDMFKRRLEVLNQTVCAFLDDCSNLRAVKEPKPTLVIDKAGKTLDIRFMSDGERSMIALVLELARRLSQANPRLENPIRDGKAIVLIDELDLHLHPSWQRTIVDRLTSTFPNCQFICSTHSPQIIGEVSPAQIILIDNGQVVRPNQSLGMDTNWILKHLMGVGVRDSDTQNDLTEIEQLIEDEQYDDAQRKIDLLRSALGPFPDLVALQVQIDMIDFWADEFDNEESGDTEED